LIRKPGEKRRENAFYMENAADWLIRPDIFCKIRILDDKGVVNAASLNPNPHVPVAQLDRASDS
jgi:hypothetical protein